MRKLGFVIIFNGLLALAGSLLFTGLAMAGPVSCGCYCGISVPPPCSDDACKRACGYQEPVTGNAPGYDNVPVPDYGAEQRAREETDRQEREEETKRLEAERQRQFIENRDEGAKLLKGNTGAAGFGLKGVDPSESGLRKPDKPVSRDIGGKQAAWKQLHCASSITGGALIALQNGVEQEFSYLVGEAAKALNGEQLGVECKSAPPLPEPKGRALDLDRIKAKQKQILERATKVAERMRPEPSVTPAQPAPPPAEGEDEIARLRRQQAAINRVQERKYDPTSQEAIKREQQAKQELTKLILENKKIEKGDFSIALD